VGNYAGRQENYAGRQDAGATCGEKPFGQKNKGEPA